MKHVLLPVSPCLESADDKGWFMSGEASRMSLQQVLSLTLRLCPIAVGEDVIRIHNLHLSISNSSNCGCMVVNMDDFNWMVSHFREFGGRAWNKEDIEFLIDVLLGHKSNQEFNHEHPHLPTAQPEVKG